MQNLKRNRLFISKLTWRIWRILTRALESLKNFHFNGFLLSKVLIVWTKKSTEELSFMKPERDTTFGKESTCRFKIGMRNLTNFDPSTRKSQKFTLSLLLRKVYIVWAKKSQRSYLPWNWRGIKNLEWNRLVFSKLTGIW